jgi:hypothetical protein
MFKSWDYKLPKEYIREALCELELGINSDEI